jgi:hypothetical protein
MQRVCKRCGNEDPALFTLKKQSPPRVGVFWSCVLCVRRLAREAARRKRSTPEGKAAKRAANLEYVKRRAAREGKLYIPQEVRHAIAEVRRRIREQKRRQRASKPKLSAMERYYANHELSKARCREIAKRRYHQVTKNDPAALLKLRLRSRIHKVLRGRSSLSLAHVLGCDAAFLKQWIEQQFKRGMRWENYGKRWHIDHIVPCSAFDLANPEDQKRCFHYSNLRPLWAYDNHSKHARIVTCQPELTLVLSA